MRRQNGACGAQKRRLARAPGGIRHVAGRNRVFRPEYPAELGCALLLAATAWPQPLPLNLAPIRKRKYPGQDLANPESGWRRVCPGRRVRQYRAPQILCCRKSRSVPVEPLLEGGFAPNLLRLVDHYRS